MSDEVEVIDAPAGFADGSAFAETPETPAAETPVEVAPEAEAAPETVDAPAIEAAPLSPEIAALHEKLSQLERANAGILNDTKQERQTRQQLQREVDRLTGQNEILMRAGQPAPAVSPRSASDVARLTQHAMTLGLYDANGNPDIDKVDAFVTDIRGASTQDIEATVTARMAPVVNILQQAQTTAKRAEILGVAQQVGANLQMVQQFLEQADPAALSTPEAALGILAMAHPNGLAGVAAAMGQAPQTAPPRAAALVTPQPIVRPNLTERTGPPPPKAQPTMSRLEQKVASARGMTQEKWHKLGDEFSNMDPHKGLAAEKY